MRVTFVSYDGDYPNLCSGHLVLAVDGQPTSFPPSCMRSGGEIIYDDNWSVGIEPGPWTIREWPDNFPEGLKEEATEVVNDNMPYGCCGGCI